MIEHQRVVVAELFCGLRVVADRCRIIADLRLRKHDAKLHSSSLAHAFCAAIQAAPIAPAKPGLGEASAVMPNMPIIALIEATSSGLLCAKPPAHTTSLAPAMRARDAAICPMVSPCKFSSAASTSSGEPLLRARCAAVRSGPIRPIPSG